MIFASTFFNSPSTGGDIRIRGHRGSEGVAGVGGVRGEKGGGGGGGLEGQGGCRGRSNRQTHPPCLDCGGLCGG